MRFILIVFILYFTNLSGQKFGCTDPQALNFDSTATHNDGSCIYPTTNANITALCSKLSDTLKESSGVTFFNNLYWTINDSGNTPYIYAFDSSSGIVKHITFISNASNTDWEEITQDSLNFYIGDFGNNAGNRKDLKIYKVAKSNLLMQQKCDTVTAEIIYFSMSDQIDFTTRNQNHNFDMEAMCFWNDSLHLFSKNWVDLSTRHYVLPVIPRTYQLEPIEVLYTGGTITGASASDNTIALCGYNVNNGKCFMYLLWDFAEHRLFSGNKRRIEIGNVFTIGQCEGICLHNDAVYITNEEKLTLAALNKIEIKDWIINNISAIGIPNSLTTNVFVSEKKLIIEVKKQAKYRLLNSYGSCLKAGFINDQINYLSLDDLANGIYIILIDDIPFKFCYWQH